MLLDRLYLQDLLQLFVVLHHEDVGLAVLSDVLTRLRGVGGVDPHSETSVRPTHNCVSNSFEEILIYKKRFSGIRFDLYYFITKKLMTF